jgi:hypothetical protein
MTCSGTRPLTSPPYLAISLIRLELRNEYSGLVVMNRVALRGLPIPMELEQALDLVSEVAVAFRQADAD